MGDFSHANEQFIIDVIMDFKDRSKELKKQIKATAAGVAKETLKAQQKVEARVAASQVSAGFNQPKKDASTEAAAQALKNKLKIAKFNTKQLDPEIYKKIQAEYAKLSKTVTGKLIPAHQRWALSSKKVKKQMSATAKKGKREFAGWAMSIMFFGMALQRIFNQIWTFGSKTFQDIQHSVEGSVTGFDMLQGSLKYLGYTIGSALEPVVMFLIPIVDAVANWVENNQELAKILIVSLGIIGSVLMVVGTLKLAFDGLAVAIPIVSSVFSTIAGVLSTVALPVILLVVAAVVALWAIWKTNLGGIQETVKGTFGVIWDTIKSVVGNIMEIFKGLFEVIEGIFSGDIDLILTGLIRVIVNSIALIIKVIMALGDIVFNVFGFIVNMVKDLIFNSINMIVGFVEKIVSFIDWVFGTSLQDGVANAKASLEELQSDLTIGSADKDSASERNEGIDNIVNNIMLNVEVALDGEKVGDAVATKIQEGADAQVN